MKIGDIIYGMGTLIMIFLVLNNWRGANALLATSIRGGVAMTRVLQGRD